MRESVYEGIYMTEAEEIQSFRDRISAAQRAVEAACVAGDANQIKSAAEELMRIADETSCYYPEQFNEEFVALERTLGKLPNVLRAAGCRVADVIVWAYKVGRPSEWMYSGSAFNSLLKTPKGEYADQGVWLDVAERLQTELKAFTEDQLGEGPSDGAYQLNAIMDSSRRAGIEQKALDLWVEYVPKIKNWKEVAERLNARGRYDEAIRVARKGIWVCMQEDDYPNDYVEEMMEPLADAFSGKGDHQKAAAILAEQFLRWIGDYEYHRSVESFNKVLREAALAGVEEETRLAIIQALKTGVNPEPLWDWKVTAPIQEFEWRPVPKLVVYCAPDALNETPRWPLARSNEGLKFSDLRWDTTKKWCQQDQEFLLKLALANGDKDEIVRRFDALPEFPNNNGMPMSDDQLEVLDAVAAAVRDVRPDIVEMIRVRPNRFRKGQ